MSFYVSDKVDYKHGVPSFEFATDIRKHYTVFPKKKAGKNWDSYDREAEGFRKKLWGLSKSDIIEPFSASVWHQNKDKFDVIPAHEIEQYKKDRFDVEQQELFKHAVKIAMLTTQEKTRQIRKTLREQELAGPHRKPQVIIPKKGPGSYKRQEGKRVEWK